MTEPLRQEDPHIQATAMQYHFEGMQSQFPITSSTRMRQANAIQAPENSMPSPGMADQLFDENIQDLNILWGGMEGNLSLKEYFPLGAEFPNDLISIPGFEFYAPALTGPSSGGTSGDTLPNDPDYDDDESLCNYQLPSLNQNDEVNSQDAEDLSERPDTPKEQTENHPQHPWRIEKDEYQSITLLIHDVRHILEVDFVFPSKYVLCRYIEGFFTGSHGHLPFLHLPTVSIASLSPPLILAIIAMGAQYRFESQRAACFFRASKSLIDNYISVHALPSSSSKPRTKTDVACSQKNRLEILQSQIILSTLGIWGHRDLLNESMSMTAQMDQAFRDGGLLNDDYSESETWNTWIQKEGRRRTTFTAYMLSNNQSILYNLPPKMLNSELTSVCLPCPEELWKASSATEWKTLRSKQPPCVPFGTAYARLFRSKQNQRRRPSLSSFGNLILIHGIFQHIFLAWELTSSTSPTTELTALPLETLSKFHTALRRWQRSWEAASDPSTITPSSPKGPLGFNATAIFRIACIRLHLNLGPHRKLETWNAETIANSFLSAPKPPQSPQVYHAVLQSIHALSIPVRLGIEYVARTQTLTWSTIHSLCNLECALFLCKWLETLAVHPEDLHADTKRLLRIIASVLREADLAAPNTVDSGGNGGQQLRQMGAVVVQLLSEILKGEHVFGMMRVFCEALRMYAGLLDRDSHPT
ncbi:hypothetical protein N7494_001002 [Penicillium frequentans]|uniref:Xylanolytic transcriptional activator regulatory domain-containing protein n=1 Tax=Penicillium frequentans TaxID=3151616 RepID=A0AAD6GM49_9EURO|nr:hypothetical protein N7494_001002 [Penicillium glabrum]